MENVKTGGAFGNQQIQLSKLHKIGNVKEWKKPGIIPKASYLPR